MRKSRAGAPLKWEIQNANRLINKLENNLEKLVGNN